MESTLDTSVTTQTKGLEDPCVSSAQTGQQIRHARRVTQQSPLVSGSRTLTQLSWPTPQLQLEIGRPQVPQQSATVILSLHFVFDFICLLVFFAAHGHKVLVLGPKVEMDTNMVSE